MNVYSNEMVAYFNSLQEQIVNKEHWDKDRFHVFNHEAGTGKSQSTFKILGEIVRDKTNQFLGKMSESQSDKVLYVQQFVRDNEMLQTVETINKHAGKEVAMKYDGTDKRSSKRQKEAKESQILCISHKMYEKICQGTNQFLIENRDILIIDEYPDLLERVTVTPVDIGELWVLNDKEELEGIESIADRFRNEFREVKKVRYKEDMDNKNFYYLDFQGQEYEEMRKKIASFIEISNEDQKKILINLQQVIENGCFFYENGFHTYNNKNQFRLLSNNIILDANAGFDHRYTLSEKFLLRKQNLHFDYSHSRFHHYPVKTDKKSIKEYANFHADILKELSPEKKENLLLITDKDNKEAFEEEAHKRFVLLDKSEEAIKKMKDDKMRIDYFGNIIGVNTYREFNSIAIVKTPNYDYLTYVLTYFFYSKMEGNSVDSIEAFKHEEVESIRATAIAGEIYQAIKRINRDNNQQAEVIVFTESHEAVEMVLKQLPNIQYKECNVELISRKKAEVKVKRESKVEMKLNKAKEILLQRYESGAEFIRKKELREMIGENDGGNFTRILRRLQPFFKEHGFEDNGQRIDLSELNKSLAS